MKNTIQKLFLDKIRSTSALSVRRGGTRKISDLRQPMACRDPAHNVPNMMVFDNGVWEHECPSCGAITRFVVNKPTC